MSSKEGIGHEAKQAAALEEVFDRIHYREFKILLKPEAFMDLETDVRDYWKLARSVARQNSAVVSEARNAGVALLREVVFFDTPGANLYAEGYMLRKRAPYVHGKPGLHFELVLKYRGPDVRRAAGVNVQAAPQYEGVVKFKEELLLVADHLGGMRSIFSHTCKLKEHRWELGSRLSEATRMFPGLEELKALPTATIRPVGEMHVEEVLFELGSIDFGGRAADVNMAVWRDATTKQILIGEFSFETHFRRYGKLEPQPKLRSERFYRLLQKETTAWVDLGTTKTALVYALAGTKLTHHE